MFKRREFLKSAVTALGAVSAWLFAPDTSSAKMSDVSPELDLETAIYRWSRKSEYSTKRLTGYGAYYGGSRDLGAIDDYVTDYHAQHERFPRGWHVVTRYFRGMNPVGTREFNVCFAPAWGDDGEPVDFIDTNVHIGLGIEDSILDGSLLTGPTLGSIQKMSAENKAEKASGNKINWTWEAEQRRRAGAELGRAHADPVEACLQELDQLALLRDPDFPRAVYEATADVLAGQHGERTEAAIRKEVRRPIHVTLEVLSDVLAEKLRSGRYHVHRGALSREGKSLLRLWDWTVDHMIRYLLISEDEATERKAGIRDEMATLG